MVGSTEGLFLSVTEEVLGLLEGQIDQLVIGGVATAAYVDGGWSGEGADLDLLLSREDAKTALTILGDAGFATEEKDPVWLFKAARPDVTVDLIFRPAGDFILDEEMLKRSRRLEVKGISITAPGPEDLCLIKAAAMDEEAHGHWFDAVRLIARNEIDWEYLGRRAASHCPERASSLLFFAASVGVSVPEESLRKLVEAALARPAAM